MHSSTPTQIAVELTRAASRAGVFASSDSATLPWFSAMYMSATTACAHYSQGVLDAAVALTEVELQRLGHSLSESAASFFLDACVAVMTASELSNVWEDDERGHVIELRPQASPKLPSFHVSVKKAA